jgi:hypothetical protein
MRKNRNPFQYGHVVVGDDFCNRRQEIRDIRRAIENGEKLFIYSERRLGKTSLVHHILKRLPKKQFLGVYVDLWPCDSESEFISDTAKAITMALGSTTKSILQIAGELFGRLRPNVTLDAEGKPTVAFGVADSTRSDLDLEEVLHAPAKIAERKNRAVVIVFDEFQRIGEYQSDKVERRLRSIVQHQPAVSYLFLGSRQHLLQEMFLNKSRPLYRAAGHYPLQVIDAKHWLSFIGKRFNDANRHISEEWIRKLCHLTEGHPFYTQHLCNLLWEQCPPGGSVEGEAIDNAVDVLLGRESYAYTTLWESLTPNQRRFLKGLAHEDHPQPYSSAFTRRYGLRSSSNAQRAADSLLERDIIQTENGSFKIVDRFLRLWILRM